MVRYARELGIALLAEGVESLLDLERLAELDVTYAQGYAIGRPAKPWQSVDPDAARVCHTSVAASLTGAHSEPDGLGLEGRLQWLAWRLSEATTYGELAEAVDAIQQELGSDDLLISLIDGPELVVVGAGGPDRLMDRYGSPTTRRRRGCCAARTPPRCWSATPRPTAEEVRVLRKLGYASVLMLPICCAGRTIGLFEAYSRAERPWSRFEIGRARIIALQLGATLERISR